MILSADVRKVFVMAVVLGSLASIFVPVACADQGSQIWFLIGDDSLRKTYFQTGGDSTLLTPDEPVYTWTVENAAECDLTIGAGTWDVKIYYNAMGGSGTITAKIYKVGDSTAIATGTSGTISGTSNTTISCSGASKDFEEGSKFKLELTWTPSVDAAVLVYHSESAGKKSTLTSPSSDPGWPVPELSTLVLFSVGLLALVGYVGYSRRRNNR
jgi:hypothetical protein